MPNPPVLNTDQQDSGAVLSQDGTLAATWNESSPQSTVKVQDTATGRTVFTLPATIGDESELQLRTTTSCS